MVPNIKKLRWLIVEKGSSEAPDFLSNDLQYIGWRGYPRSRFPDSFQPTNLAVLKMSKGLQKKLWKGRKHLPHLKVLELSFMEELVSTPDFDGLPSLQRLVLTECYKLEKIHPSLGNHKSLKYISVFSYHRSNLKKFPKIDHIKKLETLEIRSFCSDIDFEIPEIQSDMENLVTLFLCGFRMQVFLSSVATHCPNIISLRASEYYTFYSIDYSCFFRLLTHSLRKLDLSGSSLNNFSILDFKLSQLNVLVHLDLSFCNWLENLPEFPPSIVVFEANKCDRLTDVGDSIRNCKWLCQVSVRDGSILNDGDRLLQFMLQGKAIENHSMVLELQGLQVPREFQPRLRDGTRCTVHLPDNWCNDFCGFLMCAVIDDFMPHHEGITMKQVRGGSMGIDSQDGVVWKESGDDKRTWVGYVSFGSLRHTTAWLDETCKALSFSIVDMRRILGRELCRGFGVTLVPRTIGIGPTDTSPPEYDHEFYKKKYDFKPEFEIKDELTCTFWIPSVIDI
ncbi:toll/interleukin-1 receptor (TIR) domain-containing protein [Artemisia annua]|uniref:Toll/interleukin-1 receptor (TIR) domain-containing protein n=1 Tax=Artemisia annua TaxID=35608 RepID=A0A2U1LS45_ARTAN|nr:toll/interleukin-1 receptor (TIR) domain-containing protein [Artemisia annua]